MSEAHLSISDRKDRVRRKLPIGEVVEKYVKLAGTARASNRRGLCPFCSGGSPSFSVKHEPTGGFAHCFRCSFHGDVVGFLEAQLGCSFIDALAEAERLAGFESSGAAGSGRGPVARMRNPTKVARHPRELVSTLEMARAIWRMSRRDDAAVRRYFSGRGVPLAVLTDARLAAFRFTGMCPLMQWDVGKGPETVLRAPAIVALVEVPGIQEDEDGQRLDFIPAGLHVTYLNPGGDDTMVRRKPWAKPDDPDPNFPRRKMLGPVGGGCVLMGEYRPGAHLFVGEGNETVLSGMALALAPREAVGVAVLSLDNLQGAPKKWRNGALPLYAIENGKPPFVIPGHRGAVTGLIDSDMSALRGPRDQQTGEYLGVPVIEHKGGVLVRRAITGAERAQICGELLVKGWRAAGAGPVEALRAPAGMDFNDAALGFAA